MPRPIPIGEIVRLFKGNHLGSHLFKIDNFSLLRKYRVEECESSVFDIGGYKWKLVLYPNGNEKDNGEGHVSLYLEMQDSSRSLPSIWQTMFDVKLFAASQFERKWMTGRVVFDASRTMWGAARVISHVLLDDSERGFLVDDCALFGVKLLGLQGAKIGTAECFTLIEKPPSNKVTWKMTKFSTFLYLRDHKSDEFVIGNRRWRIHVYPRGVGDAEGNSLSVYLFGGGYTDDALKTKTYTRFKLRVLDQLNRKHFERIASPQWYSVEPKSWGFTKFMPLGDLHDPSKGYLVDDIFHVGVEIDVVSANYSC